MTRDVILFETAGHICALPAAHVRAFLPLPRLWRPPSRPSVLAGYADIGSRAVPVLACDRLFGLAGADESAAPGIYSHLILFDGAEPRPAPFALLVDRATSLGSIDPRQVTPASDRRSFNGCVEGQVEIEGRLVHLIDPERLLLAEESLALADLDREAERRRGEWQLA